MKGYFPSSAAIPFLTFIYSLLLFSYYLCASLVAQTVKRLPAMQEARVQSLGWEDPLEKEMATHSSTLAWKIPWTEEPGRLQSVGSQRVEHDWVTSLTLCAKSLQSCLTFCDPMDCSPPGSSVHGILQARILEWVAVPSSGEFSWPRDWTLVSYVWYPYTKCWVVKLNFIFIKDI